MPASRGKSSCKMKDALLFVGHELAKRFQRAHTLPQAVPPRSSGDVEAGLEKNLPRCKDAPPAEVRLLRRKSKEKREVPRNKETGRNGSLVFS